MRILWISLLCCLFAAVMVRGNDTNSTITIDGMTYENYHWGTVTPTTIAVFHKTGVATIPLEKLHRTFKSDSGMTRRRRQR